MRGMEEEKERQETLGAPMIAAAPIRRSSSRLRVACGKPEAENFDNALRELKDLRSQLHQAADYCEKAFLNTEKKKLILESTKSYICDAIVAVIDHLGAISSKVEHQLHDNTEITQTEQKINFLKQKVLTYEQYAITLELSTMRCNSNAVRHHQRYLSQLTQRMKGQNGANSREEDPKSFDVVGPGMYTAALTNIQLSSGKEHTMVGPNSEISPTSARRSFVFKAEDAHIVGGDHKKKAMHGNNFLSFLRKSTRRA